MALHVHGLMQDPDHDYHVRIHLIENEVPTRNQFTRTLQKIGTIRAHLRIGDEPFQGTLYVIEIAVRLRLAPLSMCLDPDIDEIGFCRLGVMDFTHQKRRSGSAPRA